MNPRHCSASLLCFAVFAAVLHAAPEPAKPGLPGPPAAKAAAPVDAKPVPSATVAPAPVNPPATTEKKSDAKSPGAPDAKTNASAPATPSEKSVPTPAPAKTKAKTTPEAAAKAPAVPQLTPRFLQVRARIDALFGLRNNPPPAPDVRMNPFRQPGAIPVAPLATLDGGAEPAPVNNNLALLQQAVATLRVRGTVTLGKVLQLVINTGSGKENTYKEGAIIVVSLAPDPVNLRVRVITRNSVTLSLGEAEMTLKF